MSGDARMTNAPYRQPVPTPEVRLQREREAAWERVARTTSAEIEAHRREDARFARIAMIAGVFGVLGAAALSALTILDAELFGPLACPAIALAIALGANALYRRRLRG